MSPYVVDFINGGSESGGKKGVAKSMNGLTGEARRRSRTNHASLGLQGLLDSQTMRLGGVKQMSFSFNI